MVWHQFTKLTSRKGLVGSNPSASAEYCNRNVVVRFRGKISLEGGVVQWLRREFAKLGPVRVA